ncbi:hypothetical protein [Namhaeicola litoreus]|uniref:Lipocalin-like domain-containing protein n=1 Tax=Namhaeicola litoreus TaxID=1052145 RepID=A0ABW3XZ90_9FLAO
MSRFYIITLLFFTILSCKNVQEPEQTKTEQNLIGTWRLLSGLTIKGNDTVFADYTQNEEMIKIINQTHFAFLRHDLNNGKDSLAHYTAGGGTYDLNGSTYTEHLAFLNYREWEGHDFTFEITIIGDTLIQTGIERIEDLGIDQKIIETYIREN